jgi:cobalt-precorrin-5B (C1)-methyltransferase
MTEFGSESSGDQTGDQAGLGRGRLQAGDVIVFRAGEGVGTVTKPGLKIPVGEPAINPVPRMMIEKEIRRIFPVGSFEVTVSIPGGANVAKSTFNPRLGIVGGLSVLGTTGVTKPMDAEALIDTTKEELNVKWACNPAEVILTFGAMGENALIKAGFDPANIAQMSNYPGAALDYVAHKGFGRIIIGGHAGKMIKLAAGIFNTHSGTADARREIISCYAALEGVDAKVLKELFDSAATTGAADVLLNRCGADTRLRVWERILSEAGAQIKRRVSSSNSETRSEPYIKVVMFLDDGEMLCKDVH